MRQRFGANKERQAQGHGRMVFFNFLLIAAVLFAGPATAIDMDFLGKYLSITGYANQSVQFGIAGDQFDTMQGFQQGLMQALLELEYHPADDVKVFVSGQLTKDWAYDILKSDDDWKDRFFDEARDENSLRDDYEDVLKECHVTWTPGNLNLRVGKQIVVWGRMDGYRIVDQINPRDSRLGPSDVEFETSISPIWLAKAEYYPDFILPFLNDFALEFVFNPNADFIPSKNPSTGNDVYGIWSASTVTSGFRAWSFKQNIEEPDRWDSDGYEYGFRFKGTLLDHTYFTLNFFDGVNNDPVIRSRYGEGFAGYGIEFVGDTDDKDNPLIHPLMEGYHADQTFVGFTFAKELEKLFIKKLGGVSPLLRGEFTYEFDATFATNGLGVAGTFIRDSFVEHDVIYAGLGVEWDFKLELLNPRRNFTLQPQFAYKHIKDYPDTDDYILTEPLGSAVAENKYQIFVMLYTNYIHDKLTPNLIFKRDIRSDVENKINGSMKSDVWIFKLSYVPNEIWSYKAQVTLMENDGYDAVDHYDNISFTVQYQF